MYIETFKNSHQLILLILLNTLRFFFILAHMLEFSDISWDLTCVLLL